VDVGTQVSGIVSKLYADFNSVVKEGQIIAKIDSTFLVQAVKDADASLDRAKAQFSDSKRNLARTKELFDRGLESQLNYDAATTTYETNLASLKSAQASLERAKINLAYATIFAPINGVVINRAVNVGQTVAASFSSPTLYTIANDLKKMQVLTTVDESDIGRVSIGQQATFTVDAYPDDKFSGTVSQIRLAPVSIQNVVNYTVVVDVDNSQLKLMPGMTANVKVLVGSSSDVLRVPNMALRFQPPSDLIDTSNMSALRAGMFTGGGWEKDTSRAVAHSVATSGADPSQGAGVGQFSSRGDQVASRGDFQGGVDRRKMFAALRDSIQAAHGGNLSREELMAEIRNLFGRMQERQQQPAVAPAVQPMRKAANTKFGITLSFPEYQKSAYVPLHQSGRGRVWILNASGKLEPVFVRTGLSDGRFTEITTETLKPGDQIIMGVLSSESASTQGTNPLTGQGQRPPGGGMR
jgi:HlyD family secretion protein